MRHAVQTGEPPRRIVRTSEKENKLKRITAGSTCALALAVAGLLAVSPALAEKPSWAGGGKSDRGERSDKGNCHKEKGERDDAGNKSSRDGDRRDHFEGQHRTTVHDYYEHEYKSGRCPPGLAKKHNGCMPPGQAKKWHMGQPLARDVKYYTVPRQLVTQIGQPPPGYRYVRVGSDILLLSPGTANVVDAILNLGRS